MGCSLYMHYGVDFAKARDVLSVSVQEAHGTRVPRTPALCSINNWVIFAFE